MFRLLVVPVVIGILAFSVVYFIFPLLFSESDIVSVLAEFALDLSNSYFASMPPLVAGYIANLNLLGVALTVGLLSTVAIQLVVIIVDTFVFVARGVVSIFKIRRKQARPPDLPSLDIDARYINSSPGKKILGGGFDSIDRD